MSQIKIYISFEVMSRSCHQELKFYQVLPCTYTIGMGIDQILTTKTFIVNFNYEHLNNIDPNFKKCITKDIQTLLKNYRFAMPSPTFEFATFNDALQKEVLEIIFKNFNVIAMVQDKQLSWQRTIKSKMEQNAYFAPLKKITNKSWGQDFIKRSGHDKDGALASYVWYAHIPPCPNYKYEINIAPHALVRNLRGYLKNDVCKIQIIMSDDELFYNKAKNWMKMHMEHAIKESKLSSNKIIMEVLRKVNASQTIKDYLQTCHEQPTKLKTWDIEKEIL